MAAETPLVESFGGTWSHEQALRLVGLGLEDSARIFQDAGVRMRVPDIIDRLTDDVHDRAARRRACPSGPARGSCSRSLRDGGHQDRTRDDVAAPHGDTRRGPDRLRGVRRRDRRRRRRRAPSRSPTRICRPAALWASTPPTPSRSRIRRTACGRPSPPGAAVIGVPHHGLARRAGAHAVWPTLAGRTAADVVDVPCRSTRGPTRDVRDERAMTVERPSGPFRDRRPRAADRPEGPPAHHHAPRGGELHTHHGVLRHAALIGQPDGSVVANSGGHEYLALRPLLRDFVDVDAARCGDRLSEGCGADPRAGGRLPRRASSSRRASARAHCRCGCCARSVRRAAASRSSAAPSSPTSLAANVETFLGERADELGGRRRRPRPRRCPPRSSAGIRRPRRARHARAVGVHRRRRRRAHARRRRALLRRDGDAAQSRVAEYIRGTGLFTEPEAPRRWCAAGTSRASRCDPITGWSRTPASSSRRAASHPGRSPPSVKRRASKIELRRRRRRAVDARRRGRPRDHRQEPPQACARSRSGPPTGRASARRPTPRRSGRRADGVASQGARASTV